MLEQVNKWNDLSPKLRERLVKKVESFGEKVRYKFEIENVNPDPEKKDGEFIYPMKWTLGAVTFDIVDKDENREGHQKQKRIGMVETVDDKGNPEKFRKVELRYQKRGILRLDLTNPEHFETAMYLELHPVIDGGEFQDNTKIARFRRIDEIGQATTNSNVRTAKLKALNVAQGMSNKEVVQFADAMSWDSTEQLIVLRDKVETLAETDPKYFNDLVESKSLEYRAIVKQAMNKQVISFNPAEYSYIWVGNSQPITVLSPQGNKSEIEKMAEWLQIGGDKATEIYKKIKSLTEKSN